MGCRVVHFEVHAADTQRAMKFYESFLDWRFQQFDDQPYWLITTGDADSPGINGGLLPRRGDSPTEGSAVNSYVCTVAVSSLDEKLAVLSAHGGKLALAKMAIQGIGWLAYAIDTEGNIFGMMQSDPQAR
jgi:uncharacterized protein